MDDRRLKEILEKAFPDTPAAFHNRMLAVAADVKKEKKGMNGKLFLRAALVCLLALSLTGGALAAANHYGVLNFRSNWESHYFTLPGAEDMIHYDLAEVRTGKLTWKVKEAAYDGRVLRVLYSVRDTEADAPLTGSDPFTDYYENMYQNHGVALEADGCGELFVNGQPVNMESLDARYSEENGEIEFWFDCRLEGYHGIKLLPEGEITVSLPFHFKNEEARAGAEADALTFSMDVGDAASRYALSLPASYDLGTGAVLSFTDLHFSPVTVFIDAEIVFSPERGIQPPEDEWDAERWNAFFESIPEYMALFDMHLENADGEILGEQTDGSVGHNVDDAGVFSIIFRYENTPSEKYTDVNYLCRGDWKVPIPMKYGK